VLPARVGRKYGYDFIEALIGLRVKPNIARAAAGLPGFANGVSRITERSEGNGSFGRGELLVRSDPGVIMEILESDWGTNFVMKVVKKHPRTIRKLSQGR
jgi:hypothetical protein